MFIEMKANEKRRLLRIAFGTTIGFAVCKLMDWPYGVFFTVFPMLLLGMVPTFNRTLAIEFIVGAFISAAEMWLLQAFFKPYPTAMWLAVLFIFGYHFRFMLTTRYFLMWASGLITLSTLLNFGSYDASQATDMVVTTVLAASISVASAYLLYWLLPDLEPFSGTPPPAPSAAQINHRTLLGALLATASFTVFQVFDLQDSLSAQVATMLILFPMTYQGSIASAKKRSKGVAYGCGLALIMQVLMYTLIGNFFLVCISLFITVMITAYFHLVERSGSGIGFGALTTIGILYGQYLTPHNDIFYSAVYRFSSVVVAMLLVLMLAYILDYVLNQFKMTRNFG
ncbi:hypothetical protein MAQ5080_00722 [Marinomonas aquimarina]|uniref:Integral membrane bound transporter domain-containing protein n=1 Tax=Marinomonas aquimarina TaxID=295068 RepID=A0A1A8T4F3_9GAMM|nr:DUF2955 domain-containing protein [Marinomonas aquimarina]SBS27076.1 hypothetical protein MAQ5080_00722 [Marinomonas aquimarina]